MEMMQVGFKSNLWIDQRTRAGPLPGLRHKASSRNLCQVCRRLLHERLLEKSPIRP